MWERVYSCVYFWDRPLSGAADFEGRPHWYKGEFDDAADDYRDAYALCPLPSDVFAVEVQREQLVQSWHEADHEAYLSGQAALDSHPVLSEIRTRYEELTRRIQAFLDGTDFEVEAAANWSMRQGECCVAWQRT